MYLYSLQIAVLTNLNGSHKKTELLSVFYKFARKMMRQNMDIPFVKYHGAGNDFVIIDNMRGQHSPFTSRNSQYLQSSLWRWC